MSVYIIFHSLSNCSFFPNSLYEIFFKKIKNCATSILTQKLQLQILFHAISVFYFFINSDPYQNNFYLEQVERAHSSNTGLIEQKLDCFFLCLSQLVIVIESDIEIRFFFWIQFWNLNGIRTGKYTRHNTVQFEFNLIFRSRSSGTHDSKTQFCSSIRAV